MRKFQKYTNWITAFVFCIAVIAVYKTFDNFKNITEYISIFLKACRSFFIGFVIAYILNMPVIRIDKKFKTAKFKYISKHSYGISVSCVYVLSFIIIYVLIRTIIPTVFANVLDFYNTIPSYLDNIEDFVKNTEVFGKMKIFEDFHMSETVRGLFNTFDIKRINEYAQGVFDVTSNVVNVFVAIIISVYMLLDKEKIINAIIRGAKAFFNTQKTEKMIARAKMINEIFVNYIYSRVICSLIMSVVCSVVLSVLGVKYAIVLGVFIGMSDMVPYFGSIVSSVAATVITLFTGGIWLGIWCGVILLILQQIDGNIISVKVMGSSLDLGPLPVIFGVVVGGSLFGFAGMVLSVPIIAVVKRILIQMINEREQKNTAD